METNASDIIGRLSFDGDVHNLKTGSYLIGNSSSKDYEHDIGIDDPSLDVKHAVIAVSHESTKLMDLFSRHGTYIDGKRVKQFEIVELTKPVKLQFGCVISHYQPSHESDSGFLGLNDSTGRDTSIIPSTPPNRNDSLSRSKSDIENADTNNSIIVKATQAPNEYPFPTNTSGAKQSNVSHFEEDDDFFIPETQEVNFRSHSDSKPEDELEINESCDIFQLNTQDFNEPHDCSNDSDDLIAHVSYKELIAEPVKKTLTPEKVTSCNQSEGKERKEIDEGSDTDCEEEILNLRLDETNKSGKSVAGSKTDVGSLASTPDLELNPNIECENNDLFEPTQAFINPHQHENSKTNTSRAFTQKDNEKDKSYADLDMTQAFVIPATTKSKIHERNLNDSESLEQTQIFQPVPQKSSHTFSTPCIDKFDKIRKSAKKAPVIPKTSEEIEPTQIFRPPDVGETSIEKSLGANDLEATQKFIAPTTAIVNSRRKSQSPVLLNTDDEDDNSEFCFAETLLVGEEPKKSRACNKDSSSKKGTVMNKLFGSDDENEDNFDVQTPQNQTKSKIALNPDKGEIQPTPNFAFFKLPGVKKLDVADAIYRAKFNSMVRSKTLLEESSDDDDENDHVKVLNRLLSESEIPLATLKDVKNKSFEKNDIAKKAKRNSHEGSSISKAGQSSAKTRQPHSKSSVDPKHSSEKKKGGESTEKEKHKESRKSHHKRHSSPAKNTTKEKQQKSCKQSDGESKRSDGAKNKSEIGSKNTRRKDTDKWHEQGEADKSREDKTKSDKDQSKKLRKHHTTHHDSDNNRKHREDKETDENMPTNKLEGVNNDKNKKRSHNSSKDDLTVPKKKSKENDAKSLPPAMNGDVIVPLRKSSRSIKPRILFTKLDSKPHEKVIEKIGGKIVNSPFDCNILITNMICRTWKFLSAMAKGVPVVSEKWLDEALAYKEKNHASLPNFDDFLIKDPDSEKRFKFTLKKSLERARHSLIFKGYTFYCTPNTKPIPKELQTIIECGGGTFVKKLSKEFIKPEKFYVISDKRDIASWLDIRNEIGDVCILSTEAILISVMQQCIQFKVHTLSSK